MKTSIKSIIQNALILCAVFLVSCQKNNTTEENPLSAQNLNEVVKAYYSQENFQMIKHKVNDSLYIVWRPQWNQYSLPQTNGPQIYYIPCVPVVAGGRNIVSNNLIINENKYLVAEKVSNGFKFYLASTIKNGKNIDQRRAFNGNIFYNKIGENTGSYQEFVNGISTHRQGAQTETCLYFNSCTWVAYCNGVQTVMYTRGDGSTNRSITCGIPLSLSCPSANWYSGWTSWEVYCSPDDVPPLPAPSEPNNPRTGGAGGAGNGALGDGGGGNYVVDTIGKTTTLLDPCFIWAINEITSKNLKNTITNTFNQIFGGAGEFSIVFDQGAYGSQFEAKEHPESNYFIDIVFNTDQLSHASKEIIIAAALHEMIHGIFDAKKVRDSDPLKWEEAFQHEIMSASYLSNMSEALQEVFPNLSYSDAEALAWGGLQTTLAWKGFALAHPAEANAILNRAAEYDKNHTKGTRCQ
ncbi:MAG TPA: hypothetical protein VM802_01420 [Chitinophaga sp.]|uniref:hypothetical protein n=1 Tax=Chitinophaga sp. TaxID=1869181 RepID=UPI002CD928E3|nr:hypothetical protein [Chitinophaga sp.]HVI43491.1 hypothetical protein [Chitinophaga sp.]